MSDSWGKKLAAVSIVGGAYALGVATPKIAKGAKEWWDGRKGDKKPKTKTTEGAED